MMDDLIVLDEFPACDTGAPCPTVLATEHIVVLSYYTADDKICKVIFNHCFEFKMGMPDENKIACHPLGQKGLQEYEFHKVGNSSWITYIEDRYNTISEFSRDGRVYEHYIFTFHDRSFECIASGYKIEYSKKDKVT